MKRTVAVLVVALVLIAVGLTTSRKYQAVDTACPEAVAHYEQGMEFYFAYRFAAAEREFRAALDLDPGFAAATAALAELRGSLGNKAESELLIARADSLAGLIADERERRLIQLWLSLHTTSLHHADQEALLRSASAADPDHLIVLHAQIERARQLDDIEEQERIWRYMLELDPNFARAYNWLGYLELYRGRYDEAISHIQKYAFLAPDLANPHDSLGEMLKHIGRYEDAEKEFKAAIKIQPDFFHSLINIGEIYIERGQLDDGVEILEKVRREIAGTEYERKIDDGLVFTYLVNNLDDAFERASARFIVKYPEAINAAALRAIRLAAVGGLDEAQAIMDSSLAAWRELPGYLNYAEARKNIEVIDERLNAYIAGQRGDYELAARGWEETLAQLADHPPHRVVFERNQYAGVLIELGRYDEALYQLDQILSVNPRVIPALVKTVQAHLALEQNREARKYLILLEEALVRADEGFPARTEAARLRAAVAGPG